MEWIYLSPHFDDVAFSCGGLIWEQVEAGVTVSVWTICAGEPPPGPISSYAHSLHERWGTGQEAVSFRRAEDLLSSQRMGASSRNFSIPDAIYRRSPVNDEYLYTSDAELFIALRQEESRLVESLRDELKQVLPHECELICPLALGGHVDHRLVRSAAEGLGVRMGYYADYPYTVNPESDLDEHDLEMLPRLYPVSERGVTVWQQAVAAHASQISTFWSGTDEMRDAIRTYWKPIKGTRLWYFT